MIECVFDALMDSVKIFPYLLITFIVLEILEHKLSKQSESVLTKNKKFGPLFGSVLGALPQCGFSAMASNLFSNRVITIGTLVAVFLSTSDEMLAIMIGEKVNILAILGIILFKTFIGMIVGLIVDLVYKSKLDVNIDKMCEEEHCDCDHDGVFISSIKHSLKIFLFILIANILINIIMFYVGDDTLSNILKHKNIFTYFISSLIGLIPNCVSSVIITKLYLSSLISFGVTMSGLLTGSGIGILLLFKTNKDKKENISILSIIYFTGVIIGMIIDLIK